MCCARLCPKNVKPHSNFLSFQFDTAAEIERRNIQESVKAAADLEQTSRITLRDLAEQQARADLEMAQAETRVILANAFELEKQRRIDQHHALQVQIANDEIARREAVRQEAARALEQEQRSRVIGFSQAEQEDTERRAAARQHALRALEQGQRERVAALPDHTISASANVWRYLPVFIVKSFFILIFRFVSFMPTGATASRTRCCC